MPLPGGTRQCSASVSTSAAFPRMVPWTGLPDPTLPPFFFSNGRNWVSPPQSSGDQAQKPGLPIQPINPPCNSAVRHLVAADAQALSVYWRTLVAFYFSTAPRGQNCSKSPVLQPSDSLSFPRSSSLPLSPALPSSEPCLPSLGEVTPTVCGPAWKLHPGQGLGMDSGLRLPFISADLKRMRSLISKGS